MTVQDFIDKNGLSSCITSDDGDNMIFEPSNFFVYDQKVNKIFISYNRDACLMHIHLYGENLWKLGEEFEKVVFKKCELGFDCLLQMVSGNEIVLYSIDSDSHVYDLQYQTGRSWNDILKW